MPIRTVDKELELEESIHDFLKDQFGHVLGEDFDIYFNEAGNLIIATDRAIEELVISVIEVTVILEFDDDHIVVGDIVTEEEGADILADLDGEEEDAQPAGIVNIVAIDIFSGG
ncbi:MAG: hypothetical protein RLN62_02315 [Rickettsiales bacterium]